MHDRQLAPVWLGCISIQRAVEKLTRADNIFSKVRLTASCSEGHTGNKSQQCEPATSGMHATEQIWPGPDDTENRRRSTPAFNSLHLPCLQHSISRRHKLVSKKSSHTACIGIGYVRNRCRRFSRITSHGVSSRRRDGCHHYKCLAVSQKKSGIYKSGCRLGTESLPQMLGRLCVNHVSLPAFHY